MRPQPNCGPDPSSNVPAMAFDIAAKSIELDVALRPIVHETAILPIPVFDTPTAQAVAKLEADQPTGSFKVRGATAKLLSLDTEQRERGVVTASTGNHGAAVAYTAERLGCQATVYIAESTDPSKVDRMRDLGAEVVTVAGDPVDAETAGRSAAGAAGRPYISPYNDPMVVAGQGTVAVELLRQLPDLDAVVVSVGGGGLIAGIATVIKRFRPTIRVIGASAANSAAMHHSVKAGEIVEVPHAPTLSDGTAGGIEEGSVTFPICRDLVDEWILVDETEIAVALSRYVDAYAVAEGSAAVALAAIERSRVAGTVAAVICGRNISPTTLDRLSNEPKAEL